MIGEQQLQAVAEEMRAVRDQVTQVSPITSRLRGFDLAAAYQVMQRNHAARLAAGERAAGRKIGFSNSDMWQRFGVSEPIWAYLYDRTVREVTPGGSGFSIARLCEPRIEPEIVFHFAAAPWPSADLDALLGCIDWFALGFEMVQSHFPDWSFAAADTVADGGLHGALLLGPRCAVGAGRHDLIDALAALSVELSCDGRLVEVGYGAKVLGSPLAALAHLVSLLARQPAAPLLAGELVSTGSLTTAQVVRAGENWRAEVRGLEGYGLESALTVRITA